MPYECTVLLGTHRALIEHARLASCVKHVSTIRVTYLLVQFVNFALNVTLAGTVLALCAQSSFSSTLRLGGDR